MHPKLIVLALACAFSAAQAAPTGGVFTLGAGTITGTTNVLVNSTDAAAKASLINWASFNVGAGESVDFNAINPAGHAFFNVDASGSRSMIFGSISTSSPDTSVYVVNPNGVTLGGSALVNVSGIVVARTSPALYITSRGT